MTAYNNDVPFGVIQVQREMSPVVDNAATYAVQRGLDFTDVGIAKDWADVDHDPLEPDYEVPTPLAMVMRLTRPQRERRVLRLIEQAHRRHAEAVDVLGAGKTVVAHALLLSGGNDSITVAHLFRDVATHIVHANTGTGIEATRVFVRQLAADWGLPLIEHKPEPGYGYRDMVLGTMGRKDGRTDRKPYPGGFPGPSKHPIIYARLKERALSAAKHDLGVAGSQVLRAVYIAGRRRTESAKRGQVPGYQDWGSVIWASPIVNWHKADLTAYRLMFDVPVNPVAEALGMSGECGCLCNASPGEVDRWRATFPDEPFLQEVAEMEELIRDRDDIPDLYKRWGWGATLRDPDYDPATATGGLVCGPDCGVDPLLDLMDPLSFEEAPS